MRIVTEQITSTATITGYVQDSHPDNIGSCQRAAVVIFPGGGYFFCSPREAEPVALGYLAEGFNAFVVDYAVGEHPAETARLDGVAALTWVRQHAGEFHTDPAKIAVVGFSAGGHLAASLGVTASPRPSAVVLGYPVTRPTLGPLLGKDLLDVVEAVDAETPPSFVFTTQGDELVPSTETLEYCLALARHGIPYETHVHLKGPHGMSLAKPLTAAGRADMVDEEVATWLPESVRFLRTILGDFPIEGAPADYRRSRAPHDAEPEAD